MTKVQFVGANDKKIQIRIHTGVLSNKEIFISPKTARMILKGIEMEVPLNNLKDAAMIGEREGDIEFLEIVKQLSAKK